MKFRQITDVATLDRFAEEFAKLSRVSLPIAYLKDARVMGAFDDQDRLMGGWVLRLSSPFRSFELFEASNMEILHFIKRAGQENIVELNGVWVNQELKSTRETFAFWRSVLKDTLDTERNFIIFGYPQAKIGLHRFYQRLHPRTIYKGPTRTGVPARIAYLTPMKVRWFYVRQAPWLLKRHLNLVKRTKRAS